MAEEMIGKLFADKYRIDSLLRSSDLGDFYRCRHAFTERPVILQIMRADLAGNEFAADRFSSVARSAAQVSHPNVLALTDFGKAGEQLYATLENIEGETLAEVLEREGQMPPEAALGVAKAAAAGLAAAHDHGLVHGNLNPKNMLVVYAADGTRSVKLFDLGSANPIMADTSAASARDFAYVAPELCSGAEKPDQLSDIYSLGVVLYEMLAGEVPFDGATPAEVIEKHVEEAPAPLSAFRQDLPAGIEPVVLKAMAKNPEMRYQTAAEFVETIDLQAVSTKGVAASVAAAAGNNIWKTGFVVLAGISLLSAFLIYATSVKRTDPVTVLQPDANGVPVQPINPATGVEEQNLAAMSGMTYDANSNVNGIMSQPPGTVPGGDGYNPWGSGGAPPPGAPPPSYMAPGGQVYQIDPNNPSQFMPVDGSVVLVPVPANTNTARPSPTPRGSSANANVQPTAPANTAARPTPTPSAAKPAASPVRPAAKPAANTATKPPE